MNNFGMSEEEKKKILEKHNIASKNHKIKKEELKKGLQKPKDDTKKS
jgi:hypothetical protein